MSKTKKKVISKSNWVSTFNCVGEAVVNDYTFKLDETSKNNPAYIYNQISLGINCGEKHGTVYSEMMGGYDSSAESVIYAHGKTEDGRDDFEKRIEVSWSDRFDEDILGELGDLCFTVVGLEKDTKDKTVYKKFLHTYDAIAYAKEHLEHGMVVNVKGSLKYSEYEGKVQVRKGIKSIVLSKAEPDKYKATLKQSVLLNKESADPKNIDKDKGIVYIDAKVLDYLKEKDGIEVKGQYPFNKCFEFKLDLTNETRCKSVFAKLLKVKKGWTQINFNGEFIEGGATVNVTVDDIPDDIKDLIDEGYYTVDEALQACSTNGNREQRVVLTRPIIKGGDNEENSTPVVQKYEEKYTDEDLILDYLYEASNDGGAGEDEEDDDETSSSGSEGSMDWLNSL